MKNPATIPAAAAQAGPSALDHAFGRITARTALFARRCFESSPARGRTLVDAKMSGCGLGRFAVLFLLSLALAGCATESAQRRQEIEQRITNARTRVDHEALAAWFEQQAGAAAEMAESHRGMGQHYVRWASILQPNYLGPTFDSGGSDGFWQRCEKLVRLYEQAAAENRALAKLHRRVAAEAK